MYIPSAVVALSQNPSTSRYLKEMGRLLRDQQLHVVTSQAEAPPATEVDLTLGSDDSEDIGWQQYEPVQSFHMNDAPLFDMFGESAQIEEGQKRFDTPHPPTSDPYFQRQKELFGGYYQTNQTPNVPHIRSQTHEPNHQPHRDTELFEALNEHIEALDQHMQTSNSLRSVIDESFPQPELEWEYDVQNGYFQVDDDYSSQQNGFELVEANGSSHADEDGEAPGQFQSYDQIPDAPTPQTNQAEEDGEIPGQFQRYDLTPDATITQTYQQPEEEFVWRQELERMAAEKRAAEEAADRAEQALYEKERLEQERLEQGRIAAVQAEEARVEQLRQEKEALVLELARQKAEEYRRRIQVKNNAQPVAIVKSRYIPQLPDTNDPLELLGLDYLNPPETADDIRRAFLKMAKKFHPDAVASDATPEEREEASLDFARINSAYQLLKEKQESMGDEYFATMLGGPMYEPRNGRNRQSFSRGYGVDDYGSIFSGSSYSATYGPRHGRPQNGGKRNNQYGHARNPFRRNRPEVSENCHVSGKDFPPFFNN